MYKNLIKITSFVHNTSMLVRLQRQFKNKVFEQDDPPCFDWDSIQGCLSNFDACLLGTAQDNFKAIVTNSQIARLRRYEKDNLDMALKNHKSLGNEFFYDWLSHCDDETLQRASVLYYEHMNWHHVNAHAFARGLSTSVGSASGP